MTKGKASAFSLSDNSDDEVEVPPYNPPPAKAKKTNSSVDLELKVICMFPIPNNHMHL